MVILELRRSLDAAREVVIVEMLPSRLQEATVLETAREVVILKTTNGHPVPGFFFECF